MIFINWLAKMKDLKIMLPLAVVVSVCVLLGQAQQHPANPPPSAPKQETQAKDKLQHQEQGKPVQHSTSSSQSPPETNDLPPHEVPLPEKSEPIQSPPTVHPHSAQQPVEKDTENTPFSEKNAADAHRQNTAPPVLNKEDITEHQRDKPIVQKSVPPSNDQSPPTGGHSQTQQNPPRGSQSVDQQRTDESMKQRTLHESIKQQTSDESINRQPVNQRPAGQSSNDQSRNQHSGQSVNQQPVSASTGQSSDHQSGTGPPSDHPAVTPPMLQDQDKAQAGETAGVGDEKQTKTLVLTEDQIQAEQFFQNGEKLINATYYKEYKVAFLNFLQAAELGHEKAKEYVAFGYLFGDYLPQNVTKAHELFEELAKNGSPKAQMGLAFMYSAGFHFNSSQAKALIYSTFGGLGGDPLAQMMLGYRYYAGIGVESKCETALTYYRKVAAKVAETVTLAGGPVVQRIRIQEETENQGTNNSPLLDEDLLQYYHFLADKGDQQAQVVLGTLYYQGGKGVQINHEKAYHYFSIAADSGSGHALGYMGKMHSEGSPIVSQSNVTAFEFFKRSSEKNNHIGQSGLGMMYLNGLGVEKDTSKAFRYFSLASDQGSVDGQLQLGIMYFSGNGVRKDYKMAVKYFTMASQNGHVLAFYNLAQMHATGTGVFRNCHTAVELFKNVAERGRWSEMMMDAHRMYHEGSVDTALVKYMFLAELGYEVAQSNVAYMLDNGVSAKFPNFETQQRALLQYSRAASQGSTHARLKMGDYHYYGLGTEVDYESAASHYRLASEQQHNAQAMFNLGYMHEMGLGLKQDVHLAKRFYDQAAETSLDAHIPVTIALFKLGLLYGMDVFSKEFEGVHSILGLLNPSHYLGPTWDLYLASLLAVAFSIIFFIRRR